jgi:glycosyltransferase involved in cell wall biosynthesis
MPSVALIIPTTGAPLVRECIASALAQTHADVRPFIVIDGPEFIAPFQAATAGMDLSRCRIAVLPVNVGRNGFYGHRVYAAFSHLVDTDYVSFLDQDNWVEAEHVASLLQAVARQGWDWAFALRRVFSEDGRYLIDDESQSVGPWHVSPTLQKLVDTNCYCLRTDVACRVANHWHGGWGQDRVFYNALAQAFPNFGCSGRYTLNYRTRASSQAAVMALLERENAAMQARYPQGLPWLQADADAAAVA